MLIPVKYTEAITFTQGIKLGCGYHMTSQGLFRLWFKTAYSSTYVVDRVYLRLLVV